MSPLFLMPSEYSLVTIESLNIQNVELFSVPLIYIESSPVMTSISNLIFKDILTPSDQSLMSILNVNSISVSNITLDNVWPMDQSSTSENIIGMTNLNLGTEEEAKFEEFDIKNSSLSLFHVEKVTNDSKLIRTVSFQGIRYHDCNLITTKALISTSDFVGSFNILVKFSNLQFENIQFNTTGSLIKLNHQLLASIEFSNVIIKGIISGHIKSEGSPTASNLSTKVKFIDSVFSNVTSKRLSFISTSKKSAFEIENSSFTGLTSLSVTSGIIAASDRSIVVLRNTVFQNNSAVSTSVFRADTEATISCADCMISDNFGITNGVSEISSEGTLKIYQSKIFSNYATKNAIGTFYSTFIPSVISETEIYANKVIPKSQILEEVSENCTNL